MMSRSQFSEGTLPSQRLNPARHIKALNQDDHHQQASIEPKPQLKTTLIVKREEDLNLHKFEKPLKMLMLL
jgi:hypothetical protein